MHNFFYPEDMQLYISNQLPFQRISWDKLVGAALLAPLGACLTFVAAGEGKGKGEGKCLFVALAIFYGEINSQWLYITSMTSLSKEGKRYLVLGNMFKLTPAPHWLYPYCLFPILKLLKELWGIGVSTSKKPGPCSLTLDRVWACR